MRFKSGMRRIVPFPTLLPLRSPGASAVDHHSAHFIADTARGLRRKTLHLLVRFLLEAVPKLPEPARDERQNRHLRCKGLREPAFAARVAVDAYLSRARNGDYGIDRSGE